MAAAKQDFPATEGNVFTRGDTIDPLVFTVEIDGEVPTSPMASVAIALQYCGKIYHRFDSADGSITINSAGQFTIEEHTLDIAGRDYKYDCRIEFEDGTVETFFYGLWKVGEDITKAA